MEPPVQIVTPIPFEVRRQFASRYFLKTAYVAVAIGALILYFQAPSALWIFAAMPLAWGGVVAAAYLLKRKIVEITEHGQLVALKEQEEKGHLARERQDRWYVRYPIALFFAWGAWWLATERGNTWWLSIVLLVLAALQARELSFILLLVLGAYLLFLGVAALPVGVAIIIGAVIIARSIEK